MHSKTVCIIFVVILCPTAFGQCLKTATVLTCKNISEISGTYLNESRIDLENVDKFQIRNSSDLDLASNSFESTPNMKHITIKFTKLKRIFANTFRNLPLEFLDLGNNEIEDVKTRSFVNLTKLSKLILRNNHLEKVNRGIFVNLPITVLTLSSNRISVIEDSAFENLTNLKKLHLNDNRLTTIHIHKVVTHPEQLEILWLYNNSLSLVSNYMLQKLSSLKVLNLGYNQIATIEPNSFEQTPDLEILSLMHNQLKEIDGSIFPRLGMDFLKALYLDNNKLMYLSSNFFLKLNNLKGVTIMGNPWFCPCLDVINRLLVENGIVQKCHEAYYEGDRPVCVAERAGVYACRYKYNESLSSKFILYRETYPLFMHPIKCIL